MRIAGLYILVGVLASCAKVGSPSGGAVDRTAPQVGSHVPSADATLVPLDTPVEIVFSESMERARTQEAVFVSPEVRVRHRWRGRRLLLNFESGLQADRTYVITVGTGARDLRRNALEQSFTFAFATGDQLNQGRIKGQVFNDHKPASSAYIWAYDLEHFSGTMGSDTPDYRTQSGRDGGYEFSRLSAARYRLFAFVDGNRNQRFDEGELLALPAGDLQVEEGKEVRSGDLALFQQVRPAVRLRRVQAVHQRRLLLHFEEAVDPQQVEVELQELEVEGLYGAPRGKRKIYVRTAPQEPGKPYPFTSLKISGQSLKWKGEPVRGSGRADRTPPAIFSRFPEDQNMTPDDTLRLVFSEAMQQVDLADFWVESDSTQKLEGKWHWQGMTSLAFIPDRSYEPGVYRLQGCWDLLRDLSDLVLKDSLIVFDFKVLAAEELARLTGCVSNGTSQTWVLAQHQSRSRTYRAQVDTAGCYAMEGLIPGSHIIFVFEDQNANSVQDHGSLNPFRPAEPYGRYQESVDLPAGGVAENIDLRFR